MSMGGPSNLGTLLIRRLDTALSIQASQQSQVVNAGRPDAVSQLADATRVSPAHNEGGRPLPETIDKALAQAQRRGREPLEGAGVHARPSPPGPGRPSTETSTTPSAPTTLGHAAKAILALLSRFPGQAPPVQGRAPLVRSEQAGPALIARGLALAVRQSGLFYESHLGDLSFGARTAAQVKLEPQGQLSGPAFPAARPGAAPQAAAAQGGASPAVPQGSGQNPPQNAGQAASSASAQAHGSSAEARGTLGEARGSFTQAGDALTDARNASAEARSASAETRGAALETRSASSAPSQAGAGQPAPPLAGLHPDTHLMVRQQLEALASQAFGWRGEAWPDAPLDWEISRHDGQGAPDEAGAHWSTRLRLALPVLGEVEARLSLHGSQVVMRLVAPQSAQTLKRHDQALRTDFQKAGLTLSQLAIEDKDEA